MRTTIIIDGETIGWSQMMKPTFDCSKYDNKVFKTFRLNLEMLEQEGNFFCFEYRQGPNGDKNWFLNFDFCFVNLESPSAIFEFIEQINRKEHITFDNFVDSIYYRYFWKS